MTARRRAMPRPRSAWVLLLKAARTVRLPHRRRNPYLRLKRAASVCGCETEHLHHFGQAVRLLSEALGGGRRLLDQRGVLLRHLVELADRAVDLADAGRL